MNTELDLAPAGVVAEPHYKALADERSRINSDRFRAFGLKRSRRELGDFLRRLALYPERIPRGNFYNMPNSLPIRRLVDHIRLYTLDSKPYAAIFHPYTRLDSEVLKALMQWTAEVGMDVCVDAGSEYYPGVTLRVVLYRQGTKFPETDLV
jgi:hypothetical protein